MKEIKVGFKIVKITEEKTKSPLGGFISFYKNKAYECLKFTNLEDYESTLSKLRFLNKYRINTPKILVCSKKSLIIVREYIDSDNCLEFLSKDNIKDEIIERLFNLYKQARIYKFDLDYMPDNYVFDGNKLLYTNIEINTKSEKYSLENYGLFYWMHSKQGCKYLSEKGFKTPKNSLSDADAKKNVVLWVVKYW